MTDTVSAFPNDCTAVIDDVHDVAAIIEGISALIPEPERSGHAAYRLCLIAKARLKALAEDVEEKLEPYEEAVRQQLVRSGG